MKTPSLVLAVLALAATAGAQTFGREVPWDTEEAGGAATLPGGNVRGTQPLRIRTARPACFVAGGFPVIRALIDPSDSVESAGLLFRPQGYPQWYRVAMRRSGPGFLAELPKPRPSARRVQYVVEVTAAGRARARGQELSAPVVEEPAQCGGVPAEMAESAAIAVRVPHGAPAVPPVPPGFMPVGAVSVGDPGRHNGKLPVFIAGGFVGALAGVFALSSGPDATVNVPSDEVNFLDSAPPPESRLSVRAFPTLSVRVRVRSHRPLGPGLVRVILYRAFAFGPENPCAVLSGAHGGFPGSTPAEFTFSGPLQIFRVCQPTDHIRLEVEENGQVVFRTGVPGPPDPPARYFIDP